MTKIETKVFVNHSDGDEVYMHLRIALGALTGLFGQPAVKMFMETEFKDRTTEEYKDQVRIPHVEIKFTCIKEEMQETIVKMFLGMIYLLVEEDQVKLSHTYLNGLE